MKNFFVFITEFVPLVLGTNNVTTIHFDKRIEACDIALNKNQFHMEKRRKNKSISLFLRVPMRHDANMTCYLEDGNIKQFKVSYSKNNYHDSVRVGDARKGKVGSLIKKYKGINIYESKNSYFVEVGKGAKINNKFIKGQGHVSKWSPILINGQKVNL